MPPGWAYASLPIADSATTLAHMIPSVATETLPNPHGSLERGGAPTPEAGSCSLPSAPSSIPTTPRGRTANREAEAKDSGTGDAKNVGMQQIHALNGQVTQLFENDRTLTAMHESFVDGMNESWLVSLEKHEQYEVSTKT